MLKTMTSYFQLQLNFDTSRLTLCFFHIYNFFPQLWDAYSSCDPLHAYLFEKFSQDATSILSLAPFSHPQSPLQKLLPLGFQYLTADCCHRCFPVSVPFLLCCYIPFRATTSPLHPWHFPHLARFLYPLPAYAEAFLISFGFQQQMLDCHALHLTLLGLWHSTWLPLPLFSLLRYPLCPLRFQHWAVSTSIPYHSPCANTSSLPLVSAISCLIMQP